MPPGRDEKERARAARRAAEAAAAARAQRTHRLQLLGGVVVIAIVVVAAAIAISSGSGNRKIDPRSKQAQSVEATVSHELLGIPQSGDVLGSPTATVTMTYFGDLKCPYCMEFTTGANYYSGGSGGLPQFISGPIRSGEVKAVYKSSCTATCDDGYGGSFVDQQSAALAAGLQGKFWNYTETFYREQQDETINYSTPSFWHGIAEQIPGLDLKQWQTNIRNPTLQGEVLQDVEQARKAAPHGTPTIIMAGPRGSRTLSLPTYAQLVSAMKAVA